MNMRKQVVVMGNGNHSQPAAVGWGGEGDKEMKMEGINQVPKEDLLVWNEGK